MSRPISHRLPGPWKNMDPNEGNQPEITESIMNGTTHELFRTWRDKYGPVFVFYEKGPTSGQLHARLVIGDAGLAKKMIGEFGQKIPDYQRIHVLGPKGVLSTGDHNIWSTQRRELSKVLSHKAVMKKADAIIDDMDDFLKCSEITKSVTNSTPIDLYPLLINTTFRMLIHSAFGKGVDFSDEEIDTIRVAIDDCVVKGIMSISHDEPDHKASIDVINNFIEKIKTNVVPAPDSIFGVIRKKNDDGTFVFSDEEQNNLMTTFLFAGHETTAKTIYWTIIELARNPVVQEKLYKEITAFEKIHGANVYNQLINMKYMTSVIQESMRLWPVVAGGTFRHVPKRMMILGDYFEENDTVIFSIDLPQSSKIWGTPEEFNPERTRHLSHFYPFSIPPRDCLGKNMALTEIRVSVFKFIREFEVSMDDPNTVVSGYYVGTMKPNGDIFLRLKRRHRIVAKL
ncbi:putative cholesterol 24-hydroxylase [Yasminevirus sp. GU-2018]|uniref:Putative cholesterol 24-hydroxylase n=1 Tax=Yasminevirus sp. GU-2018 TaxID=2420051 RepID=A0A5K0UAK4_9VIRU|nr:putative cholesterol 24-hydroxylase [Yasminevirus sp. GU-2018]